MDQGVTKQKPKGYRGPRMGRLEQGSGRRVFLRGTNGDRIPLDQVSFMVGTWGGGTEGVSKLPRPWQFTRTGEVKVAGDLLVYDKVDGRVVVMGAVQQTSSADDQVGRVLSDVADADALFLKLKPAAGGEVRISAGHTTKTPGQPATAGVLEVAATHQLRLLLASNLDQLAAALRVDLSDSTAKVSAGGPVFRLMTSTGLTALALGLAEVLAFMSAMGVAGPNLSTFVTAAQLPDATNPYLTQKLESE
jgi:hypothetical protein